MKKVVFFVLLSLAAGVLPGFIFGAMIVVRMIFDGPCPSDADIAKQLSSHRAGFEKLVTLIESDKNLDCVAENRIGDYFYEGFAWREFGINKPERFKEVLVKHKISEKRFRVYNTLLKECGAWRVMRGRSGNVTFSIWATGFVSSSSYKCLAYCPNGPPKGYLLLSNTANSVPISEVNDNQFACSGISPNWYAIYESY